MIRAAYYNEIDPYCAQWLRNLIKKRHLPSGDVDERSIEDVTPEEVRDYRQCHFFAGVGVWAYAATQTKLPKDLRVWTGSCPCQPFAAMGKNLGFDDERHLWPDWFWLIEQCRPEFILGEQSASAGGVAWLDLVRADLEGARYATGALDLYAASFGAPHARRRLFWMGHALRHDDLGDGRDRAVLHQPQPTQSTGVAAPDSRRGGPSLAGPVERSGFHAYLPLDAPWAEADWLPCADGVHRPVERGSFPLATGAAINVDAVRAYGNAIVAPVATAFFRSAMMCRP